MNQDTDDHDDGNNGEPIEMTCEPISRSKFLVSARIAGTLFHAHIFDIRNATSRDRFVKAVAAKLAEADVEVTNPSQIESRLLELIDENEDVEPAASNESTRYMVIEGNEDPSFDGIYQGEVQLTNFDLRIVQERIRQDGGERHRQFRFRLDFQGDVVEFNLPAGDCANGLKFLSALLNAGGGRLVVHCRPEVLFRAVSTLSEPTTRNVTTDFGWTVAGDAFLSPSVRIDATGLHPTEAGDPLHVDLEGEDSARFLDLAVPDPQEQSSLKRHFIKDLLGLSVARVTYAIAAAAALAVLIRFAPAMNRPALWVVGLTGDGKSFLGRLFSCLFGRFPIADGARLGSWSSTANYLQRQGYYFKDALYLVDDFKLDISKPYEVTRILQNYADGSARGRLRADATANIGRPIRGLLVSTGEDVPESSASSIARTVVVRVPRIKKDLDRGRRCREMSHRYPALMAGFIAHLIAAERTSQFADRVGERQDHFYAGIAGRQNDLRIAGNFALLSAAFAEFAEFLGDEWKGWQGAVAAFDADLLAMRDQMLAEVEEQQASAVFLDSLQSLIAAGQVRVTGFALTGSATGFDSRPVIGRFLNSTEPRGMRTFEIMTLEALKAVQEHLRRLEKPPLAISPKALIGQLAASRKLLSRDNSPVGPDDGKKTWAAKIEDETKNVFRVRASELIGEPEFRPRGGHAPLPAENPQPRVSVGKSALARLAAHRAERRFDTLPRKSVSADTATDPGTPPGETGENSGQGSGARENSKPRNPDGESVPTRRRYIP